MLLPSFDGRYDRNSSLVVLYRTETFILQLEYSAWKFFMNTIDLFIKKLLSGSTVPDEQIVFVSHILLLMDQLFSNDEVRLPSLSPQKKKKHKPYNASYVTTAISNHLPGTSERTVPTKRTYNGVRIVKFVFVAFDLPFISYSSSPDLLQRLFLLLQHASFLPFPPIELLTACLRCINGFARSHPRDVWYHMKKTGLLDEVYDHIVAHYLAHAHSSSRTLPRIKDLDIKEDKSLFW